MQYCPYVIVEEVEDRQEIPVLQDAGISAVQCYLYRGVNFSKVISLI